MMNYSSNWPTLDPQLSPEEEARLLSFRSGALTRYKILALSMTIVSIFSIVIGIIVVPFSSGIGVLSGSPIWSGVIVLIGALFGLWLGHTDPEWKTESDNSKQRCLVIVFFVFAVTSMPFCGLCIVYSAWAATACGRVNSETCWIKLVSTINIIAALTGVILIICCVVVIGMFRYYRNAFKFYNRRERFVQMQMLILQQQQQQQLAAQYRSQPVQTTHPPFTRINSGPQTGYSNTPTGYLSTHTNDGNNWSTLPPSYSHVLYSSTKY